MLVTIYKHVGTWKYYYILKFVGFVLTLVCCVGIIDNVLESHSGWIAEIVSIHSNGDTGYDPFISISILPFSKAY